MRYLTSQDVIWINSQVNRKPVGLRALDLEECIGYQYGYRTIGDELTQIGAFLQGLLNRKPFDDGNEKTAQVGTLALLRINGYCPEARNDSWLASAAEDGPAAVCAIAGAKADAGHPPELRQVVGELLT